MRVKVLSKICLSMLIIYAVFISGCVDNNGTYAPSDGFSRSGSKIKRPGFNRGKLSLIGQIKAGPLNIGVNIDETGKISFTSGLSPIISIPLGFMTMEVGIKNTIPLAEEKPDQLFIIIKDSNGELRRLQYDIGKEFQFIARKVDEVQVVQKNGCVIVTIINAQTYSSSDDQMTDDIDDRTGMDKNGKSFVVDTRDDSGLYLRSEKDIKSEAVSYVPEGEAVIFRGCDPVMVKVNKTDRRYGRWCRAEYESVEGWVWGWYVREQENHY